MENFLKKIADACLDVLVMEISEKVIKSALDETGKYIEITIEKGRSVHEERRS